jgi:CheY-like chemotaxis protein
VTELAPESPVVLGVESELREALINLIFNAVDALPEGGRVVLRTRVVVGNEAVPGTSRRQAAIEVVDSGIGMDAETRRRCLEPFFTTKGERGTGLGLAMVYGMIQRHRADLEIDSAPGQGTTMRLLFAAADRVTRDVELTAAPPETVRARVLVVDDDPLLIKSLSDTLTAEGHVVTVAHGGQAGIDLFRQAADTVTPFEVVITDLGMPHVDGRQVASSIKSVSPDTPVILLTGWGQRLVETGDVPPSVDRVMSKPPRLSELRDALAMVARLRSR